MSVCFVALLYMQVSYINTLISMRKEHLYEGARRTLNQVAHKLELDEARRYILEHSNNHNHVKRGRIPGGNQVIVRSSATSMPNGGVVSSITVNTMTPVPGVDDALDGDLFLKQLNKAHTIEAANRMSLDELRVKYTYLREVFDEAIFHMLYNTGTRPLQIRAGDFKLLEQYVKSELENNGIDIPFGVRLLDRGGQVAVYSTISSSGYGPVLRQPLFGNDVPARGAVLELAFTESGLNKFVYGSVKFMLPSLVFIFILLITFVFTLYMAVRHKKITKMKNDFINNMTHELKTPISAVSLAAQMLQDESIDKTPAMLDRLLNVITSETKRLGFQVDKVLQMSLFDDKNTAALNMRELDANDLVSNIVNTFAVKVNQSGGTITTELEADDPYICADEMHFTNVVFNLMDNAVKYRRADVPITLHIRTWNANGKFMLSVNDNGIGMKKEHLKKIFDKFYRVHTGNVHNVKGFGLGLAYVKQIVQAHRGTIRAESEAGVGTTFTIVLPLK